MMSADPEDWMLGDPDIAEFNLLACASLYNELVAKARDLAPANFADGDPLPMPNSINLIPHERPDDELPRGKSPALELFLQHCIVNENRPWNSLLMPFIQPLELRFYMYDDWLDS
jgi:hypothetical protein